METVIARLFYSKQHNWKKQMDFAEFKKSEFYECILNLDKIEDVNAVPLPKIHKCSNAFSFFIDSGYFLIPALLCNLL